MGIKISLRTDRNKSYFKQDLLGLIHIPGVDKIVICSGYFHECDDYSVLNEDLLREINNHCKELIVVSGHGNFNNQYEIFKRRLKSETKGVMITSYKAKKSNWHAKIALAIKSDKPIAGLIGSSNLTGPAYSEKYWKYNYESDVLIWKKDIFLDKYFLNPSYEELAFMHHDWNIENIRERGHNDYVGPDQPIYLILDPSVNQSEEEERLNEIYNRLKESINIKD